MDDNHLSFEGVMKGLLAYQCQICGEYIPIDWPDKARVICPKCAGKLRELLYAKED